MPKNLTATPYAELNEVLSYLVAGVRTALNENLVGVYLQGSFAIGGYTEFSDCDFIVVTNSDLTSDELTALQSLHKEIEKLDCIYWHHHLEGSYVPKEILKLWSLNPRDPPDEPRDSNWRDPGMSGVPARCYPFWYLNHGANFLVRSEHDNSQVVRWTLRERGICLVGPDVTTLIDPIATEDLKAEVRGVFDLAMTSGLAMPNFAMQAFWVGLFCRILHTIDTGTITSKKEAMHWAQTSLDDTWRDLIAKALTLRKGDAKQAGSPVSAQLVSRTREFCAYCIEKADQAAE